HHLRQKWLAALGVGAGRHGRHGRHGTVSHPTLPAGAHREGHSPAVDGPPGVYPALFRRAAAGAFLRLLRLPALPRARLSTAIRGVHSDALPHRSYLFSRGVRGTATRSALALGWRPALAFGRMARPAARWHRTPLDRHPERHPPLAILARGGSTRAGRGGG